LRAEIFLLNPPPRFPEKVNFVDLITNLIEPLPPVPGVCAGVQYQSDLFSSREARGLCEMKVPRYESTNRGSDISARPACGQLPVDIHTMTFRPVRYLTKGLEFPSAAAGRNQS